MKLSITAPSRADLAGGTLDIWPLAFLFPGACTINVAVDAAVELEMEDGGGSWRFTLGGRTDAYADLEAVAASPWALFSPIFEALPPPHPVSVTIRRQPPASSGLGGSSAVAAAAARGAARMRGEKPADAGLIALCRDAEAALMGYPTGVQDFYPPFCGGVCVIEHRMGGAVLRRLPVHASLRDAMILYHTGVAHHSGSNNWEVVRSAIEDKSGPAFRGLQAVARIARGMEEALRREDWSAVGLLMGEEWAVRRTLHPAFDHPRISEALDAAAGAGAWGGKGCGAAGGGTVALLAPPDRRAGVVRALSGLPGRVLDARPTDAGMTVASE
jgi:D-glycero-alpha-D-manno-heptose-7-phosphate kinase